VLRLSRSAYEAQASETLAFGSSWKAFRGLFLEARERWAEELTAQTSGLEYEDADEASLAAQAVLLNRANQAR